MLLNLSWLVLLLTPAPPVCDCMYIENLQTWQIEEAKRSDCVFIAEVLSIDNNLGKFDFRVVESFDGDAIGNMYTGVYDMFCGPHIGNEGNYLLYLRFTDNGLLQVNSCGVSRSFEHPEYGIPVPKEMAPYPKEGGEQAWLKEFNKHAMVFLQQEIERLRSLTNDTI